MDIMFLRFEDTDKKLKRKKITALIAIDMVKNVLLYGH